MIGRLASGYFVWDPLLWCTVTLVSSIVIGRVVYVMNRKVRGEAVPHTDTMDCRDENEELALPDFDQKLVVFYSRCIEPWLNSPYKHLFMPAVLLLIILSVLFVH